MVLRRADMVGRVSAVTLVAGILLTLSIVIIPGGSVLARLWIAGPVLWLVGAVGLLVQLSRNRRDRLGVSLAGILALAAPWVILGISYTYNILRHGLPFDIAHLVLPPSILVTAVAVWSGLRVFKRTSG